MKKYLIVFVFFVSLNVYGQFNSGSVYFTGLTGVNLKLEVSEATTSIPYDLNVEGGYFIKNRFSLGGNVHAHGAFVFGPTTGSHELFIGPAVRYYMARGEGIQIFYYGNPFFSLSNGFNTYGAAAGVGVNYFITERIALEARGLYRYIRNSSGGFGFNTHRIGFEAGISVFFPSFTFLDDLRRKRKSSSSEDWSTN